ncbi:MAG: ATP synthase F1 subunit gamma [Candidatus Tectomicrobia bacterium]|nr:ATP synthase F1 subunit gamma [Candidatus Tectomicrobia bacterium]
MANLRDIRRRITSVKNTQQITRAMKMVSAAKLRRAQERMEAARPYARRIAEVIGHLALRAAPGAHPLIRAGERRERRIVLVVVSADRGLCGSFNSGVLRRSLEFYQERKGVEVTLLTIGRKAGDYFRYRKIPVAERLDDFFRSFDFAKARRIGEGLRRRFLDDGADAVYLIYNRFRSMLSQVPEVLPLLPVTIPPSVQPPIGMIPFDFIYEPSAAAVLEALLERHVNTQVYQALLESSAGEHGARMSAMDNATTNAAEMIDKLTLFYNRARQANITRELIEVVSGADALKG